MHTFSPSKMWIEGLGILEKPYLHLHTQFNREIPWNEIDMDFMNLNQSAHGDREHGFIAARLRKPRIIAAGYWQDEETQRKIADFMAAAAGAAESRSVRCARFGDNMREVAVTEGDKIEAQIRMGWHVNSWGIGDLADMMKEIPDSDVGTALDDASRRYEMATDDIAEVRNQLRVKLALERFMKENGVTAFVTAFQDLHGMKSLPGMASQMLMEDGYGFGAEGDWKTACLLRVMKVMAKAKGTKGGTSFMEDYTYDLTKGSEAVLGAHMLEVCPSIAGTKPKIEVHPLSIGGKEPPARLRVGRERRDQRDGHRHRRASAHDSAGDPYNRASASHAEAACRGDYVADEARFRVGRRDVDQMRRRAPLRAEPAADLRRHEALRRHNGHRVRAHRRRRLHGEPRADAHDKRHRVQAGDINDV